MLLSLLVLACTTSKSTSSGNNSSTITNSEVKKSDIKMEKTVANEQTGQVPINSPAEQRIMKKKQGNTNTMPMMEAVIIPVPDSL